MSKIAFRGASADLSSFAMSSGARLSRTPSPLCPLAPGTVARNIVQLRHLRNRFLPEAPLSRGRHPPCPSPRGRVLLSLGQQRTAVWVSEESLKSVGGC